MLIQKQHPYYSQTIKILGLDKHKYMSYTDCYYFYPTHTHTLSNTINKKTTLTKTKFFTIKMSPLNL